LDVETVLIDSWVSTVCTIEISLTADYATINYALYGVLVVICAVDDPTRNHLAFNWLVVINTITCPCPIKVGCAVDTEGTD